MPIEVKPAEFPGVLLLRPQEFSDDRGQFSETYNAATFEQWLGPNVSFVQDNQTRSRRGVLRGLHYQTERVQGKLLRVLNGTIFDVVVDLRRSSRTFGRWHGFEMSASERWQIWIPPGLAHGFLTLSNDAEILYKVTDYWHPKSERTLQWNDPYLRVEWPLSAAAHRPIVSVKDAAGLAWEEAPKFD